MLDLSVVTAALTANAPSLAQVILPEQVDTQGTDSAETLLSLIEPAVSSRVYPNVLPIEPTYPAAIYRLTNSVRTQQDGYTILRHDHYEVASVSSTYDATFDVANTMRAAVIAYDTASVAGSGEVDDQEDQYDGDRDHHVTILDLRLSHLARQTQTLPAAYVYPTGESWEEGEEVSCVSGIVRSRFVVLFAAKIPAGGVSALGTLRDEIRAAVIGLDPGSDWSPVTPFGESSHDVYSSIVLWRDEYYSSKAQTYPLL